MTDRLAHLDYTTILGVVDALGLVPATRGEPIPFDLIATLAQFIEAIVLQEQIGFEVVQTPDYEPYLEIVSKARLEQWIPQDAMTAIERPTNEEDYAVYQAVKWATENALIVDPALLRYATAPRDACYRGVHRTFGINDRKNTFTAHVFQRALSIGDSTFALAFEKTLQTLACRGVDQMGLHVLYRLKLLHEWLAARSTPYLPHYSRTPLIRSTLMKENAPLSFERWAMDRITDRNRVSAERLPDYPQLSAATLALSPIFLACLVAAKTPLHILEAALHMRQLPEAVALRSMLRAVSVNTTDGLDPARHCRESLMDALQHMNDCVHSVIAHEQVGAQDLASHKPSVDGRFCMAITSTDKQYPRGFAFLMEITALSQQILKAEPILQSVFGTIDYGSCWILTPRIGDEAQ